MGTHVAGAAKVEGRHANVIMAAYHAQQAAQRCIIVGNTNTDVTEAIAAVCAEYKVEPVEGVLSHKRFPTLPFAIRSFEDVTAAKVGVKECLEHDMLLAYPVLQEKAGEVVAQFKSTVAV